MRTLSSSRRWRWHTAAGAVLPRIVAAWPLRAAPESRSDLPCPAPYRGGCTSHAAKRRAGKPQAPGIGEMLTGTIAARASKGKARPELFLITQMQCEIVQPLETRPDWQVTHASQGGLSRDADLAVIRVYSGTPKEPISSAQVMCRAGLAVPVPPPRAHCPRQPCIQASAGTACSLGCAATRRHSGRSGKYCCAIARHDIPRHRLQELCVLTSGYELALRLPLEVGPRRRLQPRVVRLELVGELLGGGVVAGAVRLAHLQSHELLLPHVVRLAHVRVLERVVRVCIAALKLTQSNTEGSPVSGCGHGRRSLEHDHGTADKAANDPAA